MTFTLEKLHKDLDSLNQNLTAAANMVQQFTGAISLLKSQIAQLNEHEKSQQECERLLKEQTENGETNIETAQQAA